MSYRPIALTIPQYDKVELANWWLKAYEAGTTIPLAMSLDSEGLVTAARVQLNSEGFTISSTGALIIPHLNSDYDLFCFPTAEEADENDTTNALRFAENVTVSTIVGSVGGISSVSVDGLEVSMSGFTIKDNSGGDFVVGDLSAILPANSARYAYIDLLKRDLRFLRDKVHDGGIFIGSFSSDASSVTQSNLEPVLALPKTKIPKTLSKLRSGASVIIGRIGDSLTLGAGTGDRWPSLLGDDPLPTLPDISNSEFLITGAEFRNHSEGGTAAEFGLSHLALVSESRSSNFNTTSNTWTDSAVIRKFSSDSRIGKSPLYSYDCVIVNYGANSGTNEEANLESIIAILRRSGVEVVLHTCNSPSSSDFQFVLPDFASRMVDEYGVAVADTWGYVKEVQDSGTATHADTIHMNQAGHNEYANALRSVLTDIHLESNASEPSGIRGLSNASSEGLKMHSSSIGAWQFRPNFTTGQTGTRAPYAGEFAKDVQNPAISIAGFNNENCCTTLNVGEYATFSCIPSNGMAILFSGFNACEVSITQQAGTVELATASDNGGRQFRMVEVIPRSTPPFTTTQNSVAYRVTCTSGQADIVGCFFYATNPQTLRLSSGVYNGNWFEESQDYSSDVFYTDTLNDDMSIDFEGTAATFLLRGRPASGSVEVYINGSLKDTVTPTSGGNVAIPYTYHIDDDPRRGYGNHVLTLKLVSESGATPSSNNRRLAIMNIYSHDGR